MNYDAQKATEDLLRIIPLFKSFVEAQMRENVGEDTTITQFRVLGALAKESLTMSALAKRRRVSLQSMSELVQSLVERGWIERMPNPNDRRQQLLQLTEQGREHHTRMRARVMAHLTPLLETFSEQELDAVETAMAALGRVLMQEEAQPAPELAEAAI